MGTEQDKLNTLIASAALIREIVREEIAMLDVSVDEDLLADRVADSLTSTTYDLDDVYYKAEEAQLAASGIEGLIEEARDAASDATDAASDATDTAERCEQMLDSIQDGLRQLAQELGYSISF